MFVPDGQSSKWKFIIFHPTYLPYSAYYMRHQSVHQTKLKDDLYQSLPHGTIKLDFIAFCRVEKQTQRMSLKVCAGSFFIYRSLSERKCVCVCASVKALVS